MKEVRRAYRERRSWSREQVGWDPVCTPEEQGIQMTFEDGREERVRFSSRSKLEQFRHLILVWSEPSGAQRDAKREGNTNGNANTRLHDESLPEEGR